ncbi:hypothetical protein AYK21_03045 [Thermoplasmatales archaeon SG8-52-2]|nr:MAG: hypothetical protein AYK21_03045 [Thermoplasmatales archaeon SG8-52-2]
MRRKIDIKFNFKIILILLLLLLLVNILTPINIIAAPGERLEIVTLDEVNEEELFIISVMDPEIIQDSPWLINVTIEFNGNFYQINDTAELEIKAPSVSKDTSFIIKASKEGYSSVNKTILVLNEEIKVLVISHDDYVVEAGERFSVTITENELNGAPVEGVRIAIQSFGQSALTDDNGRAWLTAPQEREKITIIATKDGYENGQALMEVNIPPTLLDLIIRNRYFTILMGTIILICAILFVNFKQRLSIDTRAKEISKEKIDKKFKKGIGKDTAEKKPESYYYEKDNIRVQPERESKIEEIRITRPSKEKEIVPVPVEEDKTEKIIKKKERQKRDYDWFEGTDDVRYEIDKLTGKIDENGTDKWFEGVDHHKDKINNKMKKKDKKEKN